MVSVRMPKPLLALRASRFVTLPCHSSCVRIVLADSVPTWPRTIRDGSVQGSTSQRLRLISDTRTESNMTIPAKLLSSHAVYEAVALPPLKSVSVRNNSYSSTSSPAFTRYTPHRLISEPKYISMRNQANLSIASYIIPSPSISPSLGKS